MPSTKVAVGALPLGQKTFAVSETGEPLPVISAPGGLYLATASGETPQIAPAGQYVRNPDGSYTPIVPVSEPLAEPSGITSVAQSVSDYWLYIVGGLLLLFLMRR